MKVALSILLFIQGLVFAEELEFKLKGKPATKPVLTISEMKHISTPKELQVWDEHIEKKGEPESGKITYQVLPFRKVLDAVYGASWKTQEEILFTCSDGYQPSVPIAKFLAHDSYLAFAIPGKEFVISNLAQNLPRVELAPFYLVWDNTKDEAFRKAGQVDWPYQLVGVDLISFADRFPRLAPPPKSSDTVKRGFGIFRNHCMACHSINGQGGQKLELNYPVSVTKYFRETYLIKFILEPNNVRFNTQMPNFEESLSLPVRGKKAKDVIEYLKAMAKMKQKPG